MIIELMFLRVFMSIRQEHLKMHYLPLMVFFKQKGLGFINLPVMAVWINDVF